MSKDHFRALTCSSGGKPQPKILEKQLPGRLTRRHAAKVLGFQEDDMAILVQHNMLVPLAKPRPNAPKYFATVYVLVLANDANWLGEATQVVYDHWTKKNSRKVCKMR